MQYFGGKQRIAKQISEFINTHTHTHYVEPFCGSCNVATLVKIPNKTLNDKHHYLIEMFKAIQSGWIPPTDVNEEDYKQAKINQDKEPHVAGFVGFACSFAGKYWGGYARDGKVDKSGNYALRGHNSILKKMKTLMDATFTSKDFLEINHTDSLIYCDPPYRGTTQYYKSILGSFPYDDFLIWTKEQSKNNTVLVSEYKHNVPEGAKIVLEIPSKTSIRDKTDNVIETVEVLWMWD
jgi:DNA adenine methylase